MANKRYLDRFLEESKNMDLPHLDKHIKNKILRKTKEEMHKRQAIITYGIAACILLTLICSFIPNNPVYAFRQSILSYIPGYGVVKSIDDSDTITSALL